MLTNNTLILNNVDFEATISQNTNSYIIDSSSAIKEIKDCNFQQNGIGNSAYSTNVIICRNNNSTNKIYDCTINIDVSNTKQSRATQLQGNTDVVNTKVDITTTDVGITSGILVKLIKLQVRYSIYM